MQAMSSFCFVEECFWIAVSSRKGALPCDVFLGWSSHECQPLLSEDVDVPRLEKGQATVLRN